MLGRVYSASFSAIAVTAIQDIWELNAPADASVILLSLHIAQTSDYGDAAAEGLGLEISRSTGTSGSGGGTPTAQPHSNGDAAFGGTVERNNTTQATTTTVLQSYAFNVQGGFDKIWTPEEWISIPPSGRLVVELPVAPADELTLYSTITFAEIGG